MLRITHLLERKTAQLSGGEMQRVSIGRAIVREPRLFLMDEPLSNLDAKLRESLRVELKHLQKTQGSTTLFVTHDQIEALTMADRIARARTTGSIVQIGTPDDIYDRPGDHLRRAARRLAQDQPAARQLRRQRPRAGRQRLSCAHRKHLRQWRALPAGGFRAGRASRGRAADSRRRLRGHDHAGRAAGRRDPAAHQVGRPGDHLHSAGHRRCEAGRRCAFRYRTRAIASVPPCHRRRLNT